MLFRHIILLDALLGAAIVCVSQTPHLPQKDAKVWQKVQPKAPETQTYIGCTRHDAGVSVAHYNKDTGRFDSSHDVEDWKVECTVRVGTEFVWHSDDIIPHHPISLKEAQAAAVEFIAGQGQVLVDEYVARQTQKARSK